MRPHCASFESSIATNAAAVFSTTCMKDASKGFAISQAIEG